MAFMGGDPSQTELYKPVNLLRRPVVWPAFVVVGPPSTQIWCPRGDLQTTKAPRVCNRNHPVGHRRKDHDMTPKATLFKRGAIAFGALGAVSLLAIGAGALGASAGPAIPTGKTIVVPETHVVPNATINLKTFSATTSFSAVFAG